uniref:Uncharacterized protein n=1 Tax=Populus trichocarpa TaxID=3694 RepID=A0A3N7FHJ7_POPTR
MMSSVSQVSSCHICCHNFLSCPHEKNAKLLILT